MVYVDDMKAPYGRMQMNHMIADTDEELHAMADKIGVNRRWWQAPPKHSSHYDICQTKTALALKYGAIQITLRQCACMTGRRKVEGILGLPEDAIEWRLNKSARQETLCKNTIGQDMIIMMLQK